ncbi:MAG: hypothetical protein AB1757_26520 [Acidobacteriota bacterium]
MNKVFGRVVRQIAVKDRFLNRFKDNAVKDRFLNGFKVTDMAISSKPKKVCTYSPNDVMKKIPQGSASLFDDQIGKQKIKPP